ncbi:MAG: hypothetical protein ACKOAE_04990, partial [Acidimicrobiaceae bacterium]
MHRNLARVLVGVCAVRPAVSLEVAPAVKLVFNDLGHDPKSRFTAVGLEHWFNPALQQSSFETG